MLWLIIVGLLGFYAGVFFMGLVAASSNAPQYEAPRLRATRRVPSPSRHIDGATDAEVIDNLCRQIAA